MLVDNTFATPCLIQPLTVCADLVIHSASKYLGGHGDALSGVVVTPASRQAELPGVLKIIDPRGWVNLCRELALGNARQDPLGETQANYDPDAHPIIDVLARERSAGGLRLARHHAYSRTRSYVDACHLCYEVRRFLRPYYADYSAPVHPYAGDKRL